MSEPGGAALRIPSGYSIKLAVLTGPVEDPGDAFRKNIVFSIDPVPPGQTAAQFVESQLALMRSHLEGFQLVHTGRIELGGVECPLFETRSIGPGGAMIGALVAICIRDDLAYSLSATHYAGPPFEASRADFLSAFEGLMMERSPA